MKHANVVWKEQIMRYKFYELKDATFRKNYIPNVPGFYKVFVPEGFNVVIAEKTCAISEFTKNVKGKKQRIVNQKNKSELEKRWTNLIDADVLSDRILYIGKALHLRDRLNNYQSTMFNNGKNHNGGVYICQIENCKYLEIEWYEHHSDAVNDFLKLTRDNQKKKHPIGKIVDSELLSIERKMLQEYQNTHKDLLPFANRE